VDQLLLSCCFVQLFNQFTGNSFWSAHVDRKMKFLYL
jgi:hypothetical protein